MGSRRLSGGLGLGLAVVLGLGCTEPVEREPAADNRAARDSAAPQPDRAPASGAEASACPEETTPTRLVIAAIDTVMVGCARSGPEGRRIQHGPWRKERGGRVVESGTYRDGLRHGDWTVAWPTGRPQSSGRYQHGDKVGLWTFWTDEGDVIRRVDYGSPEPPRSETAPSESSPETETETVRVSLRFENTQDSDLVFALEPFAEEYDLAPGSSLELSAEGPAASGDLVVQSSGQTITVWAWEGSQVELRYEEGSAPLR
jgi:hypothetical protein